MKKLILKLKNLKRKGAVAIKQSLEDEGASFEDIKKMRMMTRSARLDLNVKIGGCEAKNDIFFCKSVGVDGIVSPMVESQYALNKFIQTVVSNKKYSLYINLESKLAFKNIGQIIKSKNFKLLRGIIIGRSDLAGSLGLSKKYVDSNLIYKKVFKILKTLKKKRKNNFICKMGGSLTYNSKEFINKLFEQKLLDRIETRNVEIFLNKKNILNLKELITDAFEFELEWIKYKLKNARLNKSKMLSLDYTLRIKEIENRIRKNKD